MRTVCVATVCRRARRATQGGLRLGSSTTPRHSNTMDSEDDATADDGDDCRPPRPRATPRSQDPTWRPSADGCGMSSSNFKRDRTVLEAKMSKTFPPTFLLLRDMLPTAAARRGGLRYTQSQSQRFRNPQPTLLPGQMSREAHSGNKHFFSGPRDSSRKKHTMTAARDCTEHFVRAEKA